MLRRGATLRDIQLVLGHRSLKTTAAYPGVDTRDLEASLCTSCRAAGSCFTYASREVIDERISDCYSTGMSDAEADRVVELWRNSVRWRVKEVARSCRIQSALQLSERSGVNKNSINAIWNGTALRIDRDSLGKICHTLGCTPGDLLEFVGRPSDEGRA